MGDAVARVGGQWRWSLESFVYRRMPAHPAPQRVSSLPSLSSTPSLSPAFSHQTAHWVWSATTTQQAPPIESATCPRPAYRPPLPGLPPLRPQRLFPPDAFAGRRTQGPCRTRPLSRIKHLYRPRKPLRLPPRVRSVQLRFHRPSSTSPPTVALVAVAGPP